MLARKALSATAAAGGWDISTAVYDPGNAAWDTTKLFYSGVSFSVSSQETEPSGLFFKPDGKKMYIAGDAGEDINEYNLSSAWDVSTASFVQSFSVSAQDAAPFGVFFKPDGTKMYVAGGNEAKVFEYSLSTAWNISTATYVQNFSVVSQESGLQDVYFRDDGLKMYIVGNVGDEVNEYTLSTAWNVTTASFVRNYVLPFGEANPTCLFFKPDGTKMYVGGYTGDNLREFTLSTAWNISTASLTNNFSVISQDGQFQGMYLRSDGGLFFMLGAGADSVYVYSFGGFSVAAEELTPQDIAFKTDGTKMYMIGSTGDDINEYSLSTAWDVTTAAYVQNFSVAVRDTVPQAVFFKPDGTKMYFVGSTNDRVYEFSLSTAWNISTASFVTFFSVATEENAPGGLFFKDDGTKMYVCGSGGSDVNEYSLSTAWSVSSASYVQNFVVSSQDTTPLGLFFKDDGTKMYVVGQQNDSVYEYSLSTAWNISTASYVQSFSIGAQESFPTGIAFKDDGTSMYIIGTGSDKVLQYTLS